MKMFKIEEWETIAQISPESVEDAFSEEVLPHIHSLRAFAISLTGDRNRAEDLVQDTLLRALKAFDSFSRGTDCRSWLFRICKNRFYDLCRRKMRRPTHEDVDLSQPVAPERSWEVQKELQRIENGADPSLELVGDQVREAIRQLPSEFRVPLLKCDLDGMAYHEIARELQLPLGTVRSRISRARKKLRVALQDYAETCGFASRSLTAA